MTPHLDSLLKNFAETPDVKKGNMFGFSCLTVKRKVFAVSFQGDLVFKLNEQTIPQALSLPGAALWNPYGHAKKQWIQIPVAHADTWNKYALSAHDYVFSLVK